MFDIQHAARLLMPVILQTLSMVSTAVTDKQIARVVSRATGIPVDSLLVGEQDKLLHMENDLKRTVIGQVIFRSNNCN